MVQRYQKRLSGPLLDRIDIHCVLDEPGRNLMRTAMQQMNLRVRAYHRVLKLSRTIADLADEPQIQPVR